MPRQPRRSKRPLVEEHPSSVSVEYISIRREGNGRISKKRIIEKATNPIPISDVVDPLDDVHYHRIAEDESTSASAKAGGVSRAVSVSMTHLFCILIHQHISQAKLLEWIPHREETLNELFRMEAPQSTTPTCLKCQEPAVYRCLDCYSAEMMCQTCLVSTHSQTPLHSAQVHLLMFPSPNHY